ncbi:hypothetical protein [Photobacterium damselae]|uniref:hypothetical protein n=1 Tax=Photobacterium damselae TaxID=38293 RepID=UPI001F2A8AE3|nr:hypothetical protein [Photobacterium damselae]UKA04950.1 hypothetical protein IHC89_22150 [Photobacterium damselae subsp. damselae]
MQATINNLFTQLANHQPTFNPALYADGNRNKPMFIFAFKQGMKQSINALESAINDNLEDIHTAVFIEKLDTNTLKIESIIGKIRQTKTDFFKVSNSLSEKGYVSESQEREHTVSYKIFDLISLKLFHAVDFKNQILNNYSFENSYTEILKRIVKSVSDIKTTNQHKPFNDGFELAKSACISSAVFYLNEFAKNGLLKTNEVNLTQQPVSKLFSSQELLDILLCLVETEENQQATNFFIDGTEGYADTIINNILDTSACEFIKKIGANSRNEVCHGLMKNLTPEQQVLIAVKTNNK